MYAKEIGLNRDEQLREANIYREGGEGIAFLLNLLDVFRLPSYCRAKSHWFFVCFLDSNTRAKADLLSYEPPGRKR